MRETLVGRRVARRALAAVAGAFLLTAGCGGDHERPPAAEPEAVSARLATAERVELPRRAALAGTVEAERVADVAARVMAVVTAVHVRTGDRVDAGQLLLELDPQASGGQLAQAQGALAQARAALLLAERNWQRFQALGEREAASQLEVDIAQMQVEQARGAVAQAEGAVEAASSLAADTRVSAPFAGRVAARWAEVGDLAAPGRPLVRLEAAGARRIAVAVPEALALAAGLAVGATLPVRIDARPELGEMAARVVEMAPGPDPASHTVLVKAQLPVPEVAVGAAGRAWIAAAHREAVLVPAAAVLHHGGLTLVAIRDGEGRARTRAVTLGEEAEDGRIEVLSGLAGGEAVLVGLAAAPPAGARVEEVRG